MAIIWRWYLEINTKENVLDTVPNWARITGIPNQMWMDEAISQISSTLGNPISACMTDERNKAGLVLTVCVQLLTMLYSHRLLGFEKKAKKGNLQKT